MPLTPGQYYPRIGRGPWPYQGTPYNNVIVSAQQQLSLLYDDLRAVFSFIHPDAHHDGVFGHRIRNLLLLASTEFEAQCVGILEANNVAPQGRHFNTNDYVNLKTALLLDQYSLGLAMFPDYPPLEPLAGWTAANPTTSLPWYDAYNKTKHNRESEFHHASLSNAINAVAACACIFYAQIDGTCDPMNNFSMNAYSLNVFRLVSGPNIAIGERYQMPASPGVWTPVNLPL